MSPAGDLNVPELDGVIGEFYLRNGDFACSMIHYAYYLPITFRLKTIVLLHTLNRIKDNP